MAPKKSVQEAVEKHLTACAILPPMPLENDFELFGALEVKPDKDSACGAEFFPLGSGIDETFLQKWGMDEKIETLKGFLRVMMGRQLLALKKEAVMAAVKKDGMALQYASNEMKADREVVLAAVKEDGMALQFASDELKADEEVLSYVLPLTN